VKSIALVTPLDGGCTHNPGCDMITAGIEWLVRRAFPGVHVLRVDMMQDLTTHWNAAAANCQAAILCGNPRLSLSPDAYHEDEVLARMVWLKSKGLRIVDGWAGASTTLEDHGGSALMSIPRNMRNAERLRQFDLVIARDSLMLEICYRFKVPAVQLPCSSWWAREHFAMPRPSAKTGPSLAILDTAAPIPDGFAPVTLMWPNAYPGATLVNDPRDLLHMMAAAPQVLTNRSHAAIPAASLGCEVGVLAMDSRVHTIAPFNMPMRRLDRFQDGLAPVFGMATPPDTANVVQLIRSTLQ
jgi:hypothetical protein